MHKDKHKQHNFVDIKTKRGMKKRWKGIVACLCLLALVVLWREALTTLNEIILLAR